MQSFTSLTRFYNDPYLELQHGIRAMQVQQAHQWSTGRGISLAIVDTGIDLEHPDLQGHIAASESFVPDHRFSSSDAMHGTAVAGIIASTPNNGVGIVGVAPNVELVALQACWTKGSAAGICNSFTLAQALDAAIRRNVSIINLSLAGPHDPLLERLIRKALGSGVLVVAAVREQPSANAGFPATMPGVIAVQTAERTDAAIDPRGTRLRAPGVDVITTMPEGGYGFLSGSSLAAAHVSGVAALLLELDATLTTAEMLNLLRSTSGSTSGENAKGLGYVNATAALKKLREREARLARKNL